MKACIRDREGSCDSDDDEDGEGDVLPKPPHSGKNTGRDVMRYPKADHEYLRTKSSSML